MVGASDLTTWHDFYLIAGGAAATLVGLLFVGLSLHLRTVVKSSDVKSLARVTLANFGMVLLVSLFMVIPQDHSSLGVELLFSGMVTLSIALPSAIHMISNRQHKLSLHRVMMRFAISSACYVAVLVSGVFFQQSQTTAALATLVAATVLLLTTSLRNTWDLLVTVGEAS